MGHKATIQQLAISREGFIIKIKIILIIYAIIVLAIILISKIEDKIKNKNELKAGR